MKPSLIALGANRVGPWGPPIQTMRNGLKMLQRSGISIVRVSSLYITEPVGSTRQASYLNAVVLAKINCAPTALLRCLKTVERCAGRRLGTHWGPRPLDLDIIDIPGTIINWPPHKRERGRLILPHPEAHKRAFVLVPLLDVMPTWRHLALGIQGTTLLHRLGSQRRGVRRLIDSRWISCDEEES
jgi:2-amino-4-hydroxy-6-hydroxymethyldihydropteridine diphosphokinase